MVFHEQENDSEENGDVSGVVSRIHELADELRRVQLPIAQQLQDFLREIEGSQFPDDIKQMIGQKVQRMLSRMEMKVVCPKTGKPGYLRVKQAGRSTHKTFEVQIYEDGRRTSHFSSMVFPKLWIVPSTEDSPPLP